MKRGHNCVIQTKDRYGYAPVVTARRVLTLRARANPPPLHRRPPRSRIREEGSLRKYGRFNVPPHPGTILSLYTIYCKTKLCPSRGVYPREANGDPSNQLRTAGFSRAVSVNGIANGYTL